MVAAARQSRRVVQVGTQRRSALGFQQAMQQLREGVIGRVHLARAWYTARRGPVALGPVEPPPAQLDYELWQGPAPRMPYRGNRIPYNWHWFWHWGNGELGNNGVHTIDLCRWGLQVDFPVRVSSAGGRYWFDDDQETPDTQTVIFEFPEDRCLIWDGHSCHDHGRERFISFYGDQGALDVSDQGTIRQYDPGEQLVRETPARTSDDEHIANFLQAIREETPLSTTADVAEGHRSALLCHLGNIAYRTGRRLTCRPEDGSIIGDEQAARLWTREYAPGWAPTA
jgi:predicted dehydrogenase